MATERGPPVISVDLSTWPVVHVVYRASRLRLEDLPPFHEKLDRAVARGEPFVTIIDTSRLRRVPSPFVMRKNEAWVDRNKAVLDELSLGTVTITKSALARSIARWILHARRVRSRGAIVGSLEEAVEWATARLKERGVAFDEALLTRVLLRDDAEEEGPLEVAGELDPEARALVEVVASAFSEPAFLVDDRGELVFMNAAAEDLFDEPPAWVKRALSDGHSALKALCRVVPLAVGGTAFLVVPEQDLLPVRGEPAPALDLPESLQRVAEPLSRGLSDREIAEVTGLSHATVRTYVRRIFQRADVHSRGAFIRLYAAAPPRLQM